MLPGITSARGNCSGHKGLSWQMDGFVDQRRVPAPSAPQADWPDGRSAPMIVITPKPHKESSNITRKPFHLYVHISERALEKLSIFLQRSVGGTCVILRCCNAWVKIDCWMRDLLQMSFLIALILSAQISWMSWNWPELAVPPKIIKNCRRSLGGKGRKP